MRYKRVVAGEWVNPIKKGYKMMCCHCGLVHRLEFDHVKWGRGRKIRFRAWRDERATAAARRGRT